MYEIPDQLAIKLGGKTYLDTGLVSGARSGTIVTTVKAGQGLDLNLIGGSVSSTQWNFNVSWVNTTGKPVAEPDKVDLDKNNHKTPLRIAVLANDHDDDGSINTHSVQIVEGPKFGTAKLNSDGTITYVQTSKGEQNDSFTYTVRDDDGNVSDAGRVTIRRGDCPDPSPISVEQLDGKTIVHEGETCVVPSDAAVGRIDGITNELLVKNGTVRLVEKRADVIGDVYATIAGSQQSLFHGRVLLDARSGSVVGTPEINTNEGLLTVAGLQFKTTKIELGTDRVDLNGTFTLPAVFGETAIELAPDVNALRLSKTGLAVVSPIPFPNIDFPFGNSGWGFKSESASIKYSGLDDTIVVAGVFTFQTNIFKAKGAESGAALKIDLSKPVPDGTDTGVIIHGGKYTGTIAGSLTDVGVTGFNLKELTVTTNWVDSKLAAGGGAPAITGHAVVELGVAKGIPGTGGVTAKKIEGTLGFTQDPSAVDSEGGGGWRPDKVGIGVDDLHVPIGTTGFFLQSIYGELRGIGYTGTTDTGIHADVTASLGPVKINRALPSWLEADTTKLENGYPLGIKIGGDLKEDISNGHFVATGDVTATIISDKIASISATTAIDFSGGPFKISGTFTGLAGSLTGKADLSVGAGASSNAAFGLITATGNIHGHLPDLKELGLFRNKDIGDAAFSLRISDDDPNDYFLIVGTAQLNTYLTAKASLKVDLNHLTSLPEVKFGQNAEKIGSWDTVAGQDWLVMTATWDQDLYTDAHVRVRYTPDTAHMDQYVEYTRDQFDEQSNGLSILNDYTSATGISVLVATPKVGRWDIYVDDPDLGDVVTTGYKPNIAPTLQVNGQDIYGQGHYGVTYTVDDPDAGANDVMHVRFFADNDGDGFDGVEIGSDYVRSGEHHYDFTAPYFGKSPYIYLKVEDSGDDLVQQYAFQVDAESGADLVAVRSVPVLNVFDGKLVTYTVTVTNQGDTVAHGVTYVETWDNAQYVSSSGGVTASLDAKSIDLKPYSGDLAPGESATFTFTLRTDALDDDVPPSSPDDGGGAQFRTLAVGGGGSTALPSSLAALHLFGRVSSTSYEEDVRNNVTENALPFVTPGVASAANGEATDLRIEHVVRPETGATGALHYDLVVTNIGKGFAGGVTVVETLTGADVDGMRLLVPTSDDYKVVSLDPHGRVQLMLRDLPSGEQVAIPIEFSSSAGLPITATGKVAQVGSDPDPTNDVTTSVFVAPPGAGLPPDPVDWQFVKASTSLTPDENGDVLLSATLRNQTGYYTLTGPVTLKLTLPEGVSYLGAALTPDYDNARQNVGYSDLLDHIVGTDSYSTVATISADGRSVLITPPANVGGGSAPALYGDATYYGQTNFYLGFKLHVDGALPKDVSLEVQSIYDTDPNSTPGNGVATENDFVSILINPTPNAAPTVANPVPTLTATQHEAFSYTLPDGLFADTDGDPLAISASSLPRWLSYDAATRTLSGTPSGFDVSTPNNGTTDTVTLLADDGKGGRVSTTFTILIDDVQDAPVAIRHYEDRVAFVGTPFTYTLPFNYVASSATSESADRSASFFFDPDWTGTPTYAGAGQPFVDGNFKYSLGELPSWLSSASVGRPDQASPVLTGTPTAAGTYTVTVMAGYNDSDFVDRFATQTFKITVLPIDPPVASGALSYTAHEHQAFSQVVPETAFSDPNGDALSLWITGGPSWLGFDAATRTLTGAPAAGSAGAYEVTLHASDGKLGYASLPVTITVADENLAPESYVDGYAVQAGGSIAITDPRVGVLANDVDGDGDTLSASVVSGPSHAASFTLNPDGTFAYAPQAGFSGQDQFTYQASDGHGGVANADVLLYVGHAPTPVADRYDQLEDLSISVDADHGVLANDTDQDGDALRANLVSGPSHGTLTLNLDGSFDYKPAANFAGTDSFTYRANDGRLSSDPVTVSLDIANLNDRPIVSSVNPFFGADLPASGATVSFAPGSLLAGSTDPDGDPLTAILFGQPQGAVMSVDPDGGFRITPAPYNFGSYRFEYAVSDGKAVSDVRVGYVYLNKPAGATIAPPTARDDVYAVAVDTTLATADNRYSGRIDATHAPGLLVNDDQPGWSPFEGATVNRFSPLFSKIVDGPSHGALTLANDYSGVFTYTPESGFSGVDRFTYEIYNNGSGETATATATIYVGGGEPANAKPVAVGDDYTIPEGGNLILTGSSGVLANDTDADGDPLTFVLEGGASRGYFGTSPGGSVFFTPYDYVNDENSNGPITFTYRAYDGRQVSDPATVTIHVTPKDGPLQADDNAIFYEERYDGAVKTGKLDPFLYGSDKPTSVTGVQGRADLVGTPIATRFGTIEIDRDGAYTYTLKADKASEIGQSEEKIYVSVANSIGSVEKVFHLFSNFVDDAPTGGSTAYTVTKDAPLNVDWVKGVLATVQDPDGGLTADETTYHGQGDLAVVASGSFTYTPKAGFLGDDTFQVTVRSGGAPAYENVTFHVVEDGDRAPVAVADSYAATEDTPLTVAAANGVLANDQDPEGRTITASLVATTAHGALDLKSDGSFTYRPGPDFNGVDTFTYRSSDGSNDSPVTTVTINVAAVQDAPIATDDGGFSTAYGSPLAIAATALLANDRDPDGDALRIASVGSASHGVVSLSGSDVVFTPDFGYAGPASFVYTVTDGAGGSANATVSVTVRPGANSAPATMADAYVTTRDHALTVSAAKGVLANDHDPEGGAITAALAAQAQHGTVALATDGSFTYTPNAGYSGADAFTYTASDGSLASAPTRVDIDVPVSSLVVRLSEDAYAGHAQYAVRVDGVQIGGAQTADASHATGATQDVTFYGDFTTARSVSVEFLNDSYGGAGQDRNLYVQQVTVDGETHLGSEAAFSGYAVVNGTEAALLGAGRATFDLGQASGPNVGSGPDDLVVRLSEDAYAGHAQYVVRVDGVQIGGVQTADASHAAGATQDVTFHGDFAGATNVSIEFRNDAYDGASQDRNLYVQQVTIDGQAHLGSEATFSGYAVVNGTEAALLGAGRATFDLGQTSGPNVGSGPDDLVVRLSEDAYAGHAQYVVRVDGVQIGGVQTADASHAAGATQDVTFHGDFAGATNVSIEFRNDAYDGASQDRNLYVQQVTINGQTHLGSEAAFSGYGAVHGTEAELFSAGRATFQLDPPMAARMASQGSTFTSTSADETFLGGGHDTFVFKPGFGHDTIARFSPAAGDLIQFDPAIAPNFAALNLTQTGADTSILVNSHDMLLLKDVSAASLSAHDFLFA